MRSNTYVASLMKPFLSSKVPGVALEGIPVRDGDLSRVCLDDAHHPSRQPHQVQLSSAPRAERIDHLAPESITTSARCPSISSGAGVSPWIVTLMCIAAAATASAATLLVPSSSSQGATLPAFASQLQSLASCRIMLSDKLFAMDLVCSLAC